MAFPIKYGSKPMVHPRFSKSNDSDTKRSSRSSSKSASTLMSAKYWITTPAMTRTIRLPAALKERHMNRSAERHRLRQHPTSSCSFSLSEAPQRPRVLHKISTSNRQLESKNLGQWTCCGNALQVFQKRKRGEFGFLDWSLKKVKEIMTPLSNQTDSEKAQKFK